MNHQAILSGIGASSGIASGPVKIITSKADEKTFKPGDILVTKITDPSMVTIMGKAAAIVTDIGGITSHPAIVSREMGIPCVVATREATAVLKNGMQITVDGSQGKIFAGQVITSENRKGETVKQLQAQVTGAATVSSTEKNKATDQDYDDLIQSYQKAFDLMDFTTFDADTGVAVAFHQIDPLIAKLWTAWLEALIKKAQKKFSYQYLGQLLHTPNTIHSLLIFDTFMAKLAGLPKLRRLAISDFFLNILKAWCVEDPLSLRGKNVIHSDQEVAKKIALTSRANPKLAKNLGRLINSCYHAGYAMFGDMNPQLVYENYGPYHINKDGKEYLVVIKEFKNLKPLELWPEMKALPFEKITITAVYQNVEFSIDSVTHTNYQGDVINDLVYAALEIDDQPADFSRIEMINQQLDTAIQKVWSKVSAMTPEKYKELYLYQKSYNYKFLCEALGIDWKPTPALIRLVTSQPLKNWPRLESPQAFNTFLLKIIDPRSNFTG